MIKFNHSQKLLIKALAECNLDSEAILKNLEIIFDVIFTVSPKTIGDSFYINYILNKASLKTKNKNSSRLMKEIIFVCLKFNQLNNQELHICINYRQKTNYYLVINKSFNKKKYFLSEKKYIKNFGLIHQIALCALVKQIKENFINKKIYKSKVSLPAMILSPFERVGTTLVVDILDSVARGHTEPFRQHIGTESPLCPLNRYCNKFDLNKYHPSFKKQNYSIYWLNNFYASLFSVSEVQVIKETNIFFILNFILKLLPADTPIVFLFRDFRGIVSSFKKNNLYKKWDYQNKFEEISKIIFSHKELNVKYSKIINKTNRSSWIDCLLTLYIISLIEIYEHLLSRYPTEQVLIISYESLIKKDIKKINSLYKHLGIDDISSIDKNTKLLSKKTGKGEFNIYKVKQKDDWGNFLSPFEIKYISLKIKERLSEIEKYYPQGRIIVKIITPFVFDVDKNNISKIKLKSKTEINQKDKKLELVAYQTKRKKITEEIEKNMIQIKSKDVFVDNKKETTKTKLKIIDFEISKTYITNADYVSFLNYLIDNNIFNSINGNYLFYNPNMAFERGGRIFINKDKRYYTIKGFENHPVNWVNWLGAASFAKWVGMRLIEEVEWDYVAILSKEKINEYNSNIRYSVGDTTEVFHYPPNNFGLYDMFGNVRTWCRNWYHENNSLNGVAFVKAVRGGSWNRDIISISFRDYKPWLLSARGIGFRVVKDKNCIFFDDKDFLCCINRIISLSKKGYSSFEELLKINEEIDKNFN